jgi:predicted PurR-regulated permease PerM
VGALLAVPLVALLKVVLEEYLLTRPAYATVPPPLSEGSDGTTPDEDG